MDHLGDSPDSNATRRRVWRFVFCSLFVVAVVAFWPLKGYRIDEDQFASSLGPPYFAPEAHDGKPPNWFGCELGDFRTPRSCREYADGWAGDIETDFRDSEAHGGVWSPITGLPPNAVAWQFRQPEVSGWEKLDKVAFLSRYRNVCFQGSLNYRKSPPAGSREQVVRDAIAVLGDGIDRENDGVTTFYNPPARQLWHDRLRPFLHRHFPKWVRYESPWLPTLP